jgi:hypothetical protein
MSMCVIYAYTHIIFFFPGSISQGKPSCTSLNFEDGTQVKPYILQGTRPSQQLGSKKLQKYTHYELNMSLFGIESLWEGYHSIPQPLNLDPTDLYINVHVYFIFIF